MAGTGGARPGAGRKAKADKFATAIASAEKQIADSLPMLIAAMMELAMGVTVQEVDKDGETNVYTKEPNFKAIEYLMNRIMGRPTEHKEDDSAQNDRPQILGYTVLLSEPPASPPPDPPP